MMRLGPAARRVLWVVALVWLVGVLTWAGRSSGTPPTNADRVQTLAGQFACPECSGQSVASSNAIAARNIEAALAEMVTEGRSDQEIRDRIVDRFGERVSLVPQRDGFVGLVWVVPVVVAVIALGALVAALWRWRSSVGQSGLASEEDRRLVEEFLVERRELTEDPPADPRVAARP
ncbi:MAG: cytochrome c-type biogenesis protein CcmH [Acidimicrobiales bacterium]